MAEVEGGNPVLKGMFIAKVVRGCIVALGLFFFLVFGMCSMMSAVPAIVPMAPPSVFAEIQEAVWTANELRSLQGEHALDWRDAAAGIHVLLNADWDRYPGFDLEHYLDHWFLQRETETCEIASGRTHCEQFRRWAEEAVDPEVAAWYRSYVEAHCGTNATTHEDEEIEVCRQQRYWQVRSLEQVADELSLRSDQRDWLLSLERSMFDLVSDIGATCVPDDWLPEPAGGWVWPLPGHYTVTSCFGPRIDPTEFVDGQHNGLDVGAQAGAVLVAPATGTVTEADPRGWFGACGKSVTIHHGEGYSTRFCHLSEVSVTVHMQVDVGQVIGSVGSTGKSTGPHMHVEVLVFGSHIDPLTVFWVPKNETESDA